MYKAYWGMTTNPFTKEVPANKLFETEDYKIGMGKLKRLQNTVGIGLFTGPSGTGKTGTMRAFVDQMNLASYMPIYMKMTSITVGEFHRDLATKLDLEPRLGRGAMHNQIQDRIISLHREKRITPIIIVDEAQNLDHKTLRDLCLLMNFDMDSRNFAALLLAGLPELRVMLTLGIHEPLAQRITVRHQFHGIQSSEETKAYVEDRLFMAGVENPIFDDSAIECLYTNCNGSIRRLNNLAQTALIIGYTSQSSYINADTVNLAVDEVDGG